MESKQSGLSHLVPPSQPTLNPNYYVIVGGYATGRRKTPETNIFQRMNLGRCRMLEEIVLHSDFYYGVGDVVVGSGAAYDSVA